MRSFVLVSPADAREPHSRTPVLAYRCGRLFFGSAAMALVFALTSCAAAQLPEKSTAGTTTPSASLQPPSTLPVALASAAPHDSEASAPPDTSSRALELAVQAARQFCRPRLGRTQWIGDLDQLLTLQAASVYATVNPARVQCSRVELPARSGEGDGFTRNVFVRTNSAVYWVTLTRSSLSEGWLVDHIAPTVDQ